MFLRRNAAHFRPDSIPQHRRKPQQIERHDRHGDVPLAKDDRPGRDLSPFLPGRIGYSHPARDWQERIRRDHTYRGSDLELGASRGNRPNRASTNA